MNAARSKKTCMLLSKHALIFVLTALCMWHTKGLFIHASQLAFSVKNMRNQKQKQTSNFLTGFSNTENEVSEEMN
jgi:hypothetical protein